MAHALADLMRPWVKPMTHITASDLVETSLSRAMMMEMVRDPHACAHAYNAAVRAVPEAGVGPLLIRDDYVELPLWRLAPDGRRMRAYDNDLERWLHQPCSAPRLMPRALYMTALLRLGMCDLFVHGTGGAVYDVAMEQWIESWLGVTPAPKAVASATLTLPLTEPGDIEVDPIRACAEARRAWHNPEPPDPRKETGEPGEVKRELLAAIEQAPRGSLRRRLAFFAMHEQLATLRSMHIGHVERLAAGGAESRAPAAGPRRQRSARLALPALPGGNDR